MPAIITSPLIRFLAVTLLVSAGAMTWTTAAHNRGATAAIAALTALISVIATLRANSAFWAPPESAPEDATVVRAAALHQSGLVIALLYAWAALSLFLIYRYTGLSWRHGWQYASGSALIVAGHLLFLRNVLGDTAAATKTDAINLAVKLAAVHGLVIACGLLWLIASGKLDTAKSDWAANDIFLAGGFTVICLTGLIVKTHAALTRGQ